MELRRALQFAAMLGVRCGFLVVVAFGVTALAAESPPVPVSAPDGGVPDDTIAPLVEDGPAAPPPGATPAANPPTAPAPARAEEETRVVTSTRSPVALEWAPSVVSVLTREDLQSLGYRSLGEALRNATGFDLNDDGAWPDTGTRGLNDTGTHGGLLRIMVDGHDMSWRQLGWNLHDRSWVDLDDVERIEIVRGPTAAVWGSGAVSGAVNVVTRDWTQLKGAEATYGAIGAFDGQFASTRVGGVVGEVSLYGSFAYASENLDPALAPLREPQSLNSSIIRVSGARQEAAVVNLKARYRDLQLWLHQGHSDLGAPLFPLSVVGGDDTRLVSRRTIARLSWEGHLLDGLDLRADVGIDQLAFDPATAYERQPLNGTVGNPATEADGRFLRKMLASDRRIEARAQAGYGFGENLAGLRATAGLDVEVLDSVRLYFPEPYAANALTEPRIGDLHLGAWGELQIRPLEMLELTASTRYDADQLHGQAFTPRAAAVLHLPADVYVKGLYGSGFRAPSIEEQFAFRRNVAYGNAALRPETSITGELEIGYAPGPLRVSLVGFLTRLNGLVVFAPRDAATQLRTPEVFPASQLPDPASPFMERENAGFLTTAGAELDVHFEPVPVLSLHAQGSLRRPRDARDERLNYSSEWMAGAAAIWRLDRAITVTLRALATGDKSVPAVGMAEPGSFPTWAPEADPTRHVPASFITTAVIRTMLSRQVAVDVKLDNVTGAWWYDAGPVVLYPQRRFQASAWISASL